MRKSIVRDKSRSYELNFLLCSSALPSTGRKIPLSSNYMWPLRDRNISSAPQLLDSQCGVHLSSPFDWPQDSIKLKLHVAAQGPEFSSSPHLLISSTPSAEFTYHLPSTGRKIPLSSNYMWPLRDRNSPHLPLALCPMPYALCSMPSAPCPLPYALCPMPYACPR